MTNYERYGSRIIDIIAKGVEIALKDGVPYSCDEVRCHECSKNLRPDDPCNGDVLRKWLLEDDGEPSPERATGQREAWELAQKIVTYEERGGFTCAQLKEIFGNTSELKIIINNTYAEAAEKVKAWEENKRIKVGDEYFSPESGAKIIITMVTGCNVFVMYKDGSCGKKELTDIGKYYSKTGRTLPVEDWLKQIGGKDNE